MTANEPRPDTDSTIMPRGRRRVLEVDLAGVGSVVRGFGSRGLVQQVTGRPPVWRSAAHGWSVQETTASDVVAAAERAGYDIVITGPRATVRMPPAAEPVEPDEARLW